MQKKIFILIVVLFVSILLMFSCSKRIYQVAYPTLGDGRYDSEFPYKSCSEELEQITKTVRKLFCIIKYKNYIFNYQDGVTVSWLDQEDFRKAADITYFQNSVAGTCTIIYFDKKRIALLTCAHVVTHPDTIITYFKSERPGSEKIIQSVSIKEKQDNFVIGIPEGGDFEILLSDEKNDIAILHREFTATPKFDVPTLNYPFGKARDLEWGSFVYLIGFPKGYKIITKGIVSHPNRDKDGSFLIDALFNRGLSGGILLAIRDGVPNFEVVGITTSAAAEFATVLVPERGWEYDETVPYEGEIFVDHKKNINYGITRAIASEVIMELVKNNKNILNKHGLDLEFIGSK